MGSEDIEVDRRLGPAGHLDFDPSTTIKAVGPRLTGRPAIIGPSLT